MSVKSFLVEKRTPAVAEAAPIDPGKTQTKNNFMNIFSLKQDMCTFCAFISVYRERLSTKGQTFTFKATF